MVEGCGACGGGNVSEGVLKNEKGLCGWFGWNSF